MEFLSSRIDLDTGLQMNNTAIKLIFRREAHRDFALLSKHFENDVLTIVSRFTVLPTVLAPEKIEPETHIKILSRDPSQTMSLVCCALANAPIRYIDDIEIVGVVPR